VAINYTACQHSFIVIILGVYSDENIANKFLKNMTE